MFPPVLHNIHKQQLWLSANKTIYWEDTSTLILSDLHLGKAAHFRKAGLAVPNATFHNDIHRLTQDVQYFSPKQLLIVGDMFHSEVNAVNAHFEKWRKDFHLLDITLVKGNHDIITQTWYQQANIKVVQHQLVVQNFCFVHEVEKMNQNFFYFVGHTHPGIVLSGVGKRSLRLPVFHFSPQFCTLPAFGSFTGLHIVDIKKQDTVYAIAEGKVFII
jgi:DNA ligase-associated metallophosphoesterase